MNTDRRQKSIDFHRNYCVHYEPREGKGCAAGQDMQAIRCVPTGPKGLKWGPCIGGHELPDPLQHCPKWQRPSQEDAEKHADAMEAIMTRMEIVDPVIGAWKKKKPIGKTEVIECPACQGRLHLTQSSYNGHVRAKCETEGCVNFIE